VLLCVPLLVYANAATTKTWCRCFYTVPYAALYISCDMHYRGAGVRDGFDIQGTNKIGQLAQGSEV
jgi:hypothetical protein